MHTFTVVCVGARPRVHDAADEMARDLTGYDPVAHRHRVYRDVLTLARNWLTAQCPGLNLTVVHAATLQDVPAQPALRRTDLLVVDADTGSIDLTWPLGPALLEHQVGRWPAALRPELSTSGTYVYREAAKLQVQPVVPYTLRRLPTEPWILAADLVCAVTDQIEARLVRPTAVADTAQPTASLADALFGFLTARAGNRWALWSYTGSVVSGLIQDLERRAVAAGNPVLRGPSEHSLACGALARWQLDAAPFLIVVTSGMVDEFRGTLANLRDAGAQGFIVCADAPADRWFPFQGTVHAGEDSREVLQARRLPAVFLDRADSLTDGVRQACATFDAGRGPVVVLATPSALEARGPVEPPVPATRPPDLAVTESQLDAVVRLLNHEPMTLLWQVGAVRAADRDLLYDLADRAGAALVDSLARPGAVAAYHDGVRVPNYLGTLGLYGTSPRVLDYLFRDGRPRPGQCLFFLASRIAEITTPFSERTLRRAFRTLQVTHRVDHLAPFAAHRVHAELGMFLRAVADRLAVDADVLHDRRTAIATARPATEPAAMVPVRPMTPPYFFRRLNEVVEQLIETQDYRYTGVYDVGRGGVSAIRNVARTGPGFSGWYGRALMGDALQAIPAIALTRPGNVLAFIGDGAAALVPDILPSILQQICLDGRPLRGNLSVFRLLNGGHSIIRSYREARVRAPAVGQTSVFNLLDTDWTRTIGPVRIVHRQLEDVDDLVRTELTEPSTINLYSVLLSHTSAGDALSLLTLRGWQRQPAEDTRGEQPR